MTWTVQASGHTPTPDGETGWHGVEQKLFAELQAVLSKPEYGAANSLFHGNHVDGEPHVSPEESVTTQHSEPAGDVPMHEQEHVTEDPEPAQPF